MYEWVWGRSKNMLIFIEGEILLYALWPPMTLSLPITKIKDIAVHAKVKVNSEFTMY